MFDFLNDVAPLGPHGITTISTFSEFAAVVLNIAIAIGIGLVLVTLGLAGIKYVTSQGDPKNLDNAQKSLTYSIIALLLTLAAFSIRYVILRAIGANGALLNATPGIL